MSTIKQRVASYLQGHLEGATDAELHQGLGLKSHQQANRRCRQLESEGLVKRIKLPAQKIRNYWHGAVVGNRVEVSEQAVAEDPNEVWFWEGNVQARIVEHLRVSGWTIERTCNISANQKGIDILASKEQLTLGIEVKGYPSTVYQRGPNKGQPKRTPPKLQAKHWFANALMAAILRQTEMPDAQIALGFPYQEVYVELLKKMGPSLAKLGIACYMVPEHGSVWAFPKEG